MIGACGLILIFLQIVVLGAVCPYCLLIDAVAVGIAVLAAARYRLDPLPALDRRIRGLWAAGALLACASGAALGYAGFHQSTPGQVPPEVAVYWVPDKITVVEVADFECPHCRRMHAVLAQFLGEEGDRIHFVQLTAPLPGHLQARTASRTFLCAQAQGKGRQMAEALFAADNLSPQACEYLAGVLRLDLPAYQACLADDGLDGRLDATARWVEAIGLPAIWVQDQLVSGAQPIEKLRDALREVERRTSP
jgi:predicted DsbA family dithiol-disulfide isomerase